jgi:KDO2-lipid IV(A) lauroyltransferase
MRTLQYLIEAAALVALFCLLRLLPLDAASWLGGWLARKIGPWMRAHRIAWQNLHDVFPEKSDDEKNKILTGMWDNLGRTAAELPHLPGATLFSRVTIVGGEHMYGAKSLMFFSGHLGNWELLPVTAESVGAKIALAYRKANNPYVDVIIAKLRATRSTSMFQKGAAGAVKLVRAVKGGQSLAMLVDQKMNEGIPVKFFGRDAMTAPAVAQLALRYDMPIIPARAIRKNGAHFDVAAYPPLVYEKTGDETRDVLTILTAINAQLEAWIREYPEQWFWVHKRWPG